MSERFQPRQTLQDPDVAVIGAFGGLSSASYQTTGDILYADKLVNAYVTNRNEIVRRRGSRVLTYAFNRPLADATNSNCYKFTFDGIDYIVHKVQNDLYLYAFNAGMVYSKGLLKSGVFYSNSNSEPVSFTTVIEDDNCYILCATKSTPLVVGVLIRRNLNNLGITNATQFTGNLSYYPATNVITQDNTNLYDTNNTLVPTTTVSQSTFTLSFTTPSAHGQTVNSRLRVHSFFWCRGTAANYYPGNYIYNTAIRRNSVPLDVNVQLPTEISANPIIDESTVQDLSIDTVQVWQTQDVQTFTRATGGQPNTATQWDFSDGSYTAGANNRTTRTPNFVSFGALSAGGNNERIYVYRLREVLPVKGLNTATTNLRVFTDRNLTTVNYYNAAGATTTTSPKYFTFPNTSRPASASVCELVYLGDTGVTNIVDLTKSTNATIQIGDGWGIPLYGYSAFNDVGFLNYCPLVLSVGNRVVLSGYDNRVVFSDANWNYRGMSWNNFQVSSINFSATSAYSIALAQQSSKVLGMASVNGVLIAATDTGIFRINGGSANIPPNASTANVSRLSNEIVNSNSCLLVYESRVFFVSSNGLFQLQYSQDTEELSLTPISVQVSDYFKRVPLSLNYSTTYRAFIIGFRDTSELLVYSFESEAFSIFEFAFTPASLRLSQTLDGYMVTFAQTGGTNFTVHLCQWDNALTTDLANATDNLITGSPVLRTDLTINGNTLNVGTSPTDLTGLCVPSELVGVYGSSLVQAYGDNHARSLAGTTLITEHSGGRAAAPILSYVVTKSFMSDKLIRSGRVRAVNLLVAGSGNLFSTLVFPNKDTSQRKQEIELTTVNINGTVKPKATIDNMNTRTATGDTVNIRLRTTGINEAWAIAVQLTDDLKLLGWQIDSSSKKRGRIN